MSKCCHSQPADPNKNSACHAQPAEQPTQATSCCAPKPQQKTDWLLWISTTLVAIGFVGYWWQEPSTTAFYIASATTVEMLDAMWIGMALGVFIVGWLGRIPREIVMATIGKGHTVNGLFRATLAGLLLDLCNHGILMVGVKLYERGASLGQVMAFIIASPWNSFTLTFILFGLIGWQWTLAFIALSLIIAWISGYLFDRFEMSGTLPANPNRLLVEEDISLKPAIRALVKNADYSPKAAVTMLVEGFKGSRMVFRWVMVGIVLVALIRAFVPAENFALWYGATTSGLLLTLLAATIIEVCSEGSTPIAADLLTRAHAPGNAFTFLMAGAATDYTEVMVLKDTTKSWKIALFLPLITVPQVLLIGWLINIGFGG